VGSQGADRSPIAAAFTGQLVAEEAVQLLPVAPASAFAFAPYWLELGKQPAYGAARLRIELPSQITTSADPLLVTGPSSQGDFVSIAYPYAGQISFGYLQPGTVGPHSRRFPGAPGTRHGVEIDMPSLYPAETDAFFATRKIEEIVAAKRDSLHLSFDGKVVFNVSVPYFDSTAEQITPGENRISNVYGPGFTGKILAVERSRFQPPPGFDAQAGPLQIVFILPAATSGKETLLATGAEAAPDALVLNYDGPGRCHFSIQTADGHAVIGDSIDAAAGSPHTLLVQWGGFYGDAARRQQATVSLDGRQVLAGRLDFQFGTPQRVSIGRASPAAPEFSGWLQSIQRLPVGQP
jgi:hypothetical protein